MLFKLLMAQRQMNLNGTGESQQLTNYHSSVLSYDLRVTAVSYVSVFAKVTAVSYIPCMQ